MGSSKPAGNTTTTTKAEPWEGVQPQYRQAAAEAQRLYGSGGASGQYDYDAYNKALSAYNASGGPGVSVQSVIAPKGKGDQWGSYLLSDGSTVSAYGRTGLAPGAQWAAGSPQGPAPTLEQFAIPGSGTTTNSLLAPNYYPGSTIAGQSPETLAAQSLTTQRAVSGSPITNAGRGLLSDTLAGDYLDVTKQPGFRQGMMDITDAFRKGTAAQTDAAFGQAGAYGGSAYKEMTADNSRKLADALTRYTGDAYQQERQRQMQGLLFAPQMANQDYYDIGQLANVGEAKDARSQDLINADIARYEYTQNQPYQALQNYFGLLGQGNVGNTKSAIEPYYQNRGAGIAGGLLGGGLAGAQLGPMVGMSGPWGAAAGAGIGLLGSIFK